MKDPAVLAEQLIEADAAARTRLLRPYRSVDHTTVQALAVALKQAYDVTFSQDQVRAAQALVH